ncbi:unnamed protein product [Sphenostylis stenocarpa]|uniref:Leucine-rich repeat-containing N-terminal plant-type domain-containing protein n=1 Tax=Sphenostylis stenocarpa TaxID=92480 RepID=A0AA86TF98_9FABA|nr:unnamed protein product [Sphenostylis stenocarpa]
MRRMMILGLCFLLFSPFPLAFSERCHPQDKKALLQLKNDLNNPYILASWNPKEDCCDWYCVRCDEKTNRIYDLDISSSVPDPDVSGQIPPSVGDLPYLDLSGSIPSSLYQLPKLSSLQLDRNELTGSFGSFNKPGPYLILSHNQLSGSIPDSLGNLDPERIDFSRNKLEGDASMLFGSKKRTQTLDLSRNALEFDLSHLTFPKKSLIWLDLNHNKIYGSIPVALTTVENLQQFNVSYNRLCGEIPQGGRLQRFDEYSYLHNKCLCGSPLPPCNFKADI